MGSTGKLAKEKGRSKTAESIWQVECSPRNIWHALDENWLAVLLHFGTDLTKLLLKIAH